ncbi:MAG: AAA family ATPase [Nitrospirota bacterium]
MNKNYRLKEVAQIVGVAPITLKRWLLDKKIAEVTRDRKGWRVFTMEDIRKIQEYANTLHPQSEEGQAPIINGCKTITILNQKGGVAKTVTTLSLAHALAIKGRKILICDLDPQYNATLTLSNSEHPKKYKNSMSQVFLDRHLPIAECIYTTSIDGVDFIPGSLELTTVGEELRKQSLRPTEALKDKINSIQSKYSFILFDCPPSSLDLKTINALAVSNYFIIPIKAGDLYSMEGFSHLFELVQEIQEQINPHLIPLGILMTMYVSRRKVCDQMEKEMRDFFKSEPIPVFKTRIRDNTDIQKAVRENMTIFQYNQQSIAAMDYMDLAEEILNREERK